MDPFSILSLLGGAAGAIGNLFAPKISGGFSSEAEYQSARAKYNAAVRSGNPADARTITELEPAITAWEQGAEQRKFAEEQRQTALTRLDESQTRGTKSIISNLYSRGLRGKGEIYSPVEELRRQVSEQREDINTGRRQEEMNTRQQLEMQGINNTIQNTQSTNTNISNLIGLGLSTAGEFRQGGAFGGETEWEKYIKKMQGQSNYGIPKISGVSPTLMNYQYGGNNNTSSYKMGYR